MVLNPNYKVKPKTGFKTSREAISYIKHNFGNGSGIYEAHEKLVLYLRAKGTVR